MSKSTLARSSDDLLRSFFALHEKRNMLRKSRSGYNCARAEPDTGLQNQNQNLPCWKDGDVDEQGRWILTPSEWCDPCQKRQKVNDELRAVAQKHGGALRGLLRRGKRLGAQRLTRTP